MGKRRRRLTRPKFAAKFATVRKEVFGEEQNEEIEEILLEPELVVEESPAEVEELESEEELLFEEVEVEEEPDSDSDSEWEPIDFKKLKKSELLDMALAEGLDVTSKNTKAQIIAELEKQSA